VTKKDRARSKALAEALGALGYPGFTRLDGPAADTAAPHDPAVVLMAALRCHHLDASVVEALPWLVLRHADLDWRWLIVEARRHEAQNRLGFIVGLALRVGAGCDGLGERLARLAGVEEELFAVRLEREDTLWQEIEPAEKKYLRETRNELAGLWRQITEVDARGLAYDGFDCK
jgi:hypothetical protein